MWARENRARNAGINEFLAFLDERIKEKEYLQASSHEAAVAKKSNKQSDRSTCAAEISGCIKCKLSHALYQCTAFKALTVPQRIELVKEAGICSNCLRFKHKVSDCKYTNCKKCSKMHNTLLHEDNISPTTSTLNADCNLGFASSFTLLPTAIIHVKDASGSFQPCRALLDSGSQSTLIAEACIQRLQLKRRNSSLRINGIGGGGGATSVSSRGRVQLTISTLAGDCMGANAFILQKLTSQMPQHQVDKAEAAYFKHLKLADANFDQPRQIDLLLDSSLVFKAFTEGSIQSPSGELIARNSVFGWVIAGSASIEPENLTTTALHSSFDNLETLVKSFWQQEEILSSDSKISDEEIERHFMETHQIGEDGRFVVSLPFRSNAPSLGDSSNLARKRLLSMEKRFERDKELKQQYVNFLREYETLGHMTRLPSNAQRNMSFILPHHAIVKSLSTTTKLRVVFDASAQTSNAISLNDCLQIGPVLQSDLFSLLIRFRKFRVAFCADIAQMYRQIWVAEADRKYQCIYWRENTDNHIELFQLNTLTYGTAPASFLATRVLKQIAENNMQQHPAAARRLTEQFYMDDYMGGEHSLQESLVVTNGLTDMLNAAGMRLRKWASNSQQFLESIPIDDQETCFERSFASERGIRALGLMWHMQQDTFNFQAFLHPIQEGITKRQVLSHVAKIFDPFGWLAPTTIYLKLFLKTLWSQGLKWDDPIPQSLICQWNEFLKDASNEPIRIPRWIRFRREARIQLHVFADSSQQAFAAVIYSRVYGGDSEINVSLLASKTRVAPTNPRQTIPRLELCAALLAAQLAEKVLQAWQDDPPEIYAWSDSTAVLYWIKGGPTKRREIFIENRVIKIISLVGASSWNYIPTHINPADAATRGISPRKLTNLNLWWEGPDFLRKSDITLFPIPITEEDNDLAETVINTSSVPRQDAYQDYLSRFSRLHTLVRIVARIKRLAQNAISTVKETGCLKPKELDDALKAAIKLSQESSFHEDLNLVRNNKPFPKRSKLYGLNIFQDQQGLLRLDSRLKNATIPYAQQYPIILHKEHHLTQLIIDKCHRENLHSGIRHTTYLVSLNFYIIGCANAVRRCIFRCTVCQRQRQVPYKQQMGQLPSARVQPTLPFTHTGIDFCGPFNVRSWKGRGGKTYKSYVALFICLATKAMHLEAVTDLTTQAFIAALKRFVARRGLCRKIYSDNGLNFVGADQYLRDLSDLHSSREHRDVVCEESAKFGIEWHFTPPYTPHFGGLWETGVKTVKYHLRRVVGGAFLTFEELATVLCQIEACANSRPLCQRFEGDVDPLTPSHFLIFRAAQSIPDNSMETSSLTRWQFLQGLVRNFWKKWSSDYLHQLRRRPKWLQKIKSAQVDDVVVLKDDAMPPCKWLLGRITRTYPGDDGLVRAVDVATCKGEYRRPICKLCPLFSND